MSGARELVFRDDDGAGFQLRILQAVDGDFHISVLPHAEDFKHEHQGEDALFAGCYSASIRVRMPMIGGGSHSELWHALAKLFRLKMPEPVPKAAMKG